MVAIFSSRIISMFLDSGDRHTNFRKDVCMADPLASLRTNIFS
jgi:hypothetical protein